MSETEKQDDKINRNSFDLNESINIPNLIGAVTAFALIVTVVYLYAFTLTTNFKVLKYFKIADVLDFSVMALGPIGIAFFVILIIRIINLKTTPTPKLLKIILSLVSIIWALTLAIGTVFPVDILIYGILTVANLVLVMLALHKKKINLKDAKSMFPDGITGLIVLVIIAYLYGAGQAFISEKYTNVGMSQTIAMKNKDVIEGNVVFLLSEYTLVMQKNDEKIDMIALKSDEILSISVKK